MNQYMEDRTFLHDLASPLSILRLNLRRVIAVAENKSEPLPPEKQARLLQQMMEAIKKMEALHADHKERVEKRNESAA